MFSSSGKMSKAGKRLGGDPHFDKVVLLLPMDGPDWGTTFTDIKGHTVTPMNGVVTSTSTPIFGKGTAVFNGTSASQYLNVAASSDFNIGSQDMCVECHFIMTSATAYLTFISSPWYSNGWTLMANGSGAGPTIYWSNYNTGAPLMSAAATTHRDGLPHHVKWCKSGNAHSLWVDGVQVATATASTVFIDTGAPLIIGNDTAFGGRGFVGSMANFRITIGANRLDEGVPTGPYPTYKD